MILENERLHVEGREADYVLGLLPRKEHQSIAHHIAFCDQCRSAVEREKQIATTIEQTFVKAGAIDQKRLQLLRPRFSQPNTLQKFIFRGQRQLLIAGLTALLVVASIGLQLKAQKQPLYSTSPAILSTTVLMTETPTASLVATSSTGGSVNSPSPTPGVQRQKTLPEAILAPEASAPLLLSVNTMQ